MVSPIGKPSSSAFTLMEVLVVLVIVGMITLLVATGLRVAIRAWNKGVEEDDKPQISAVVPALLAKQLACIVTEAPFPTVSKKLPFCGGEHEISFFTSYSPIGSTIKGLLRVSYIFDPHRKTLSFYEQVVTNVPEFIEQPAPYFKEEREGLAALGEINSVETFSLFYGDKPTANYDDEDVWKDEWRCDSASFPKAVKLIFHVGKPKKGGERETQGAQWIFKVGP